MSPSDDRRCKKEMTDTSLMGHHPQKQRAMREHSGLQIVSCSYARYPISPTSRIHCGRSSMLVHHLLSILVSTLFIMSVSVYAFKACIASWESYPVWNRTNHLITSTVCTMS